MDPFDASAPPSLQFVATVYVPHCFVDLFSKVRLLFNRKNKTLRSVLMTRSVLKLLDDNRKTVQSLMKDGGDGDAATEEQSAAQILEQILEQEAWKGKRASKLDLDDFLQLLAEFNAAGIHFS